MEREAGRDGAHKKGMEYRSEGEKEENGVRVTERGRERE